MIHLQDLQIRVIEVCISFHNADMVETPHTVLRRSIQQCHHLIRDLSLGRFILIQQILHHSEEPFQIVMESGNMFST